MSTSNLLNNSFDDSDEEDDNFNPQPADLSDNEDEGHHTGSAQRNEASRHQVGDDDGSEDESAPASGRKHSSGGGADDGEDEDEDEEGDGEDIAADDDEEDEEEEEDDDEEEITRPSQVFLDVEAEVDEDEDENEDDEDELNEMKDTFIADTHPDDMADLPDGGETDDRRHRDLDRRREMEASLDAEKQAEFYDNDMRIRSVTKSPTIEVGALYDLGGQLNMQVILLKSLKSLTLVSNSGPIRTRLDYGLHEDTTVVDGKRKRPVAGPRPPQRLFSEAEAKKRHASICKAVRHKNLETIQ
ncbi:hypothetical protein EYC84_007128 [Monilinia fructicola]|uniref:Spt5 transcription elongation factor N-terminal domain-containing protein n=1 Tax=Monilinia fructicola TaxID=38448 RepID=A0A5M9K8B3_MONFR|nr:hypothetical protein EYC84_007128 [Monilinia fructicola]